ncbi:redoxin family protein [Sessilibacter corallicola]|uniref:Thioredoxin domain-containing protein n=1 Tax=Sessilibacter corallicola TaxID=2904075 RepID=A0ABQ0A4R7_9GAMM
MVNLLIASNIALWLCVVILGLIVFALVRQIGVLYERVAPAGALSVNKQLSVGDKAPVIDVSDINSNNTLNNTFSVGAPNNNKSQLLFFVAPDCPICSLLIPIVKSVAKAERHWVDLVFASDDDSSTLTQFIQSKQLSDYPFINSELVGTSYGVSKLPYAVLIDESGIIRSLGIVNSREHIESLFNAKEIGVASLQEYMQKNYA